MSKKPVAVTLIVIAVLAASGTYEWRYSDDMQRHIDAVNLHLQSASLDAALSGGGLFASLRTMTAEADVGGEIISTHEYVHTLKDEVLAWKIKKAVEQSFTVGGAVQAAIAKWPGSI